MIENPGIYNATQEYRMEAMMERCPRLSGTLRVVKSMLSEETMSNKEFDLSLAELYPIELSRSDKIGGFGLGWYGWEPARFEAFRPKAVDFDTRIRAHAGVMVVFDNIKSQSSSDVKKNETVGLVVYSSAVDDGILQVNKSYGEELRVVPEEFVKNHYLLGKLRKQIKEGLPQALVDRDSAEFNLKKEGMPISEKTFSVFVNSPIRK